jgi:hypothetical protein
MKEINVTFVLRGHLMWYPEDKKKVHNISVDGDLKIVDVLNNLNIPIEQISYVLKNDEKTDINETMKEGDQIDIAPKIVGG